MSFVRHGVCCSTCLFFRPRSEVKIGTDVAASEFFKDSDSSSSGSAPVCFICFIKRGVFCHLQLQNFYVFLFNVVDQVSMSWSGYAFGTLLMAVPSQIFPKAQTLTGEHTLGSWRNAPR